MVNKCVVTNCSTGYKTGQKKASFHFHEDQELKRKLIYFVNRKDWLSTAHSVICTDHFEEKNIKHGKNFCDVAGKSNPSLLRTPTIPGKSPRKQNI